MKNYLSKHILLTISIISFILLFIPVIVFLYYFGDKTVSDDLSAWASFGDFVGGTLNIVLSLSSLVILGLLTHNIGKQSNEENKNTNILLRKFDSYDLISKYLTDMELVQIKGRIDLYKIKDTNDNSLKEIYFNKMEERVTIYFQLYALLQTFPYRFGHLFKYDFNTRKYKNLVSNAKVINDLYTKLINHTDDEGGELTSDQFFQDYENFFNSLHSFLEDLAKELN